MATISSRTRSRLGRPTRSPEVEPASADDLAGQVRETMADFKHRYGRAPRVLCVGNVANNGYNNGKILVRAGWDCDVVCYDYYHIMGCPEWEDADFIGSVRDQFHPDWADVDLRGFKRPAWFVQGPRHLCVRMLLARRGGHPLQTRFWNYMLLNWQRPHVQRATEWFHRGRRFARRWRQWLPTLSNPMPPIIPRAIASLRRRRHHLAGQAFLWRAWFKWRTKTTRDIWVGRIQLLWASLGRRLRLAHRESTREQWAEKLPPWSIAILAPLVGFLLVAYYSVDFLVRGTLELGGEALHFAWRAARFLFQHLRAGLRATVRTGLKIVGGVCLLAAKAVRGVGRAIVSRLRRKKPAAVDPFDARLDQLIQAFAEQFPERADQLTRLDMEPYRSIMPEWRKLCSHYDMVIGYATDGIYPLLMGNKPYVSYEHGTIRNIPFESNTTGRLCSLTYRMAGASVITNCDNILAAERLRLTNHRFIPHPINEDWMDDRGWMAIRQEIQQKLKTDFIVFHPSRQHWEAARHPDWEKGNDFFIRGFARFVHEVCPTASAVFVEWGKTLAESKALLAELGVADRVHWIEPQPTVRMIRYIRACDVVADQFYLGAFGGVMPKAMVYGRPSLIYLDESRHRWCFDEMPPIHNTRTPDDVFEALSRLNCDPKHREQMIADGLRWYAQNHSSDLVAKRFCDILRELVPF